MSNLSTRIEKLEQTGLGRGLPRQVWRVIGNGTPADMARFLAVQGIAVAADDLIIQRCIMRSGVAGPQETDAPMRMHG